MAIVMRTKGAEDLGRWLEAREWSQDRFGRELYRGKPVIAQGTVSQWISGDSRPRQVHLVAIERMTGIDSDAWLTADERARLRHVAKGAA